MDTMNTYPLVSVVLATYNGERFLKQQLDSLFCQTYPNIEIVGIDDNSSDNTREILNEYSSRHSNMKVFINENNLGFVKNFDKGCSLSTGDFIALCDQDDCWSCDKLEKLIDAIGDYPMIYSDSFLCKADLEKSGKRLSDIVNCSSFNSCLQQTIFCRIYGHTTLFTRNLYKQAHPFLEAIPHDWWLSFVATLYGGITYLPEPLVLYRQHESNLFGVVGSKKRKHQRQNRTEKNRTEQIKIRMRIRGFYTICPSEKGAEKKVLLKLVKSYSSFSLRNNIRRVALFLRYRNIFLMVKKHSALHRTLFCFKMFVKIK